MAHPKSKISKQRKRKRRTHIKATAPDVVVCKKTGEAHLWHRAYWHEGDLYYRGKVLIKAEEEV
jgi:large subunit ribosomal protein L32